jgi:hypothetical protein
MPDRASVVRRLVSHDRLDFGFSQRRKQAVDLSAGTQRDRWLGLAAPHCSYHVVSIWDGVNGAQINQAIELIGDLGRVALIQRSSRT